MENIMQSQRLLEIKDLYAWYKTYAGYAKVINGVNFHVDRGERVGLVGESGCGKTTLMKTLLRIVDIHVPEGEIFLKGKSVLKLQERELQSIRQTATAMISQEPMAALNPVFTIGQQLHDIVVCSGYLGKNPDAKKVNQLMADAITKVMIPDAERILKSYPGQLSGGMRQRVCIVAALLTPRDLIIADEPGTALDVTIQDQVHRMLRDLTTNSERSLIMITHSLGVVRELVSRVYVMYAGGIVEHAPVKDLFSDPKHPYTVGLLDCVPRLSGGGLSEGIYGYIPDYVHSNYGCRFYPRCRRATEICRERRPDMREIRAGHTVACWLYSN